MAEDTNIGRVVTEQDLLGGGEFYQHEPTGMTIFPMYCSDGSISSRSVIALWVEGRLTTYEVDGTTSDMFRGKNTTLTITRKMGVDNG